jgi:hypothetical protein
MTEPGPIERRPMPPNHHRITSDGADQFVLACNARRDAGELTFENLLRLEREIDTLRADIAWKQQNASTRSGRWVVSKAMIFTYVVAALVLAGVGLRFTESGRAARIGFVKGQWKGEWKVGSPWVQPHFLLSDMTRHEIDSLNAVWMVQFARKQLR